MEQRKLFFSKEHGQSLVEFAISLTILLILVAGIFDASRALFTYLSLRDAAQEGALYASIDPTNLTDIVLRTCQASDLLAGLVCEEQSACSSCDVSITVNYTVSGQACMGATGGNAHGVEVIVDYPAFPLTMPLIGQLIGRENTYTVPIRASVIDTIITPTCP